MSTQRQRNESTALQALNELTECMDPDWCRSRKGLRERVQSSQWWCVVAANEAGVFAISDLRSAVGRDLFLALVPVTFCHGPVIACAGHKSSLSQTQLQSILARHDERLRHHWPGQDLIIISSEKDAEPFRAAIVAAITAEPRGLCVMCRADLYQDDDCHYCQHDLLEVFPEAGPQVIQCYEESLRQGFHHPVILLFNVLSRVGRLLCEELRGSREVDSIRRRAEDEGRDAPLVPHAIAFEQLRLVLGTEFDENEIKPLTEKRQTHVLACLVSDAGPILLNVPMDRKPS